MEITLNIAEDSAAARNIENVVAREQLSREQAALRLIENGDAHSDAEAPLNSLSADKPRGAHPDAYKIIGAFSSPEDAKLMDEVMELVMAERERRNSVPPLD